MGAQSNIWLRRKDGEGIPVDIKLSPIGKLGESGVNYFIRDARLNHGFKVPHTLVILFSMVVLAQVLTYVIPTGSFDRAENADGRLQVVPGSFHLTPETPALSPIASLTAIPNLLIERVVREWLVRSGSVI
jgi:hypothetical protein